MSEIKNFAQVHAALQNFYGTHTKAPYTLDRMRQLMKALGDPQESLKVIHIAGTSGKTSTAYYIASLLTEAGFSAGLTVSPHVDEINERVQIDMKPLDEADFCQEFSLFLDIVQRSNIMPSYYECMVAFAYWVFARLKVDYAVVEVGLGGLLDATNIASRADKVCVITDIGFDHTEILGTTLPLIAAQKAGIIHPDNRVFMHRQSSEVMSVIEQKCQNEMALLHTANVTPNDRAGELPLFQQRNFNLALFVVESTIGGVGQSQIQAAAKVYIPARMEILRVNGKVVVMDGAHNAQKLETFFESLKAKFPHKKMTALVGFTEGDVERLHGSLDVIVSNVSRIIISSFYTEKDYPKHSVPSGEIVAYCQSKDWNATMVQEDPVKALDELLKSDDEVMLVIGSFYLMNHVRPLLHSLL